MRTRITKAELDKMVTKAASHTFTDHSTFGWYDAVIVMEDGQHYRVSTESLNPTSDALVQEITPQQATALLFE